MCFNIGPISELYYGGEALTVDQPQSFCCPFCGKLGLTESGLPEHVTAEHPETSQEVVSISALTTREN